MLENMKHACSYDIYYLAFSTVPTLSMVKQLDETRQRWRNKRI